MKKQILLSLCLCLLLAFSSCVSPQSSASDTTAQTKITVSAEDAGIISHGFIVEEDFPTNERLTEWYADAVTREYVPGAIIYSKDDTDGLWHCWLYLVSYTDGDMVTLRGNNDNGLCVLISHASTHTDATGSTGAHYFTVNSESTPSFELTVNGEKEGLIITHADISVSK